MKIKVSNTDKINDTLNNVQKKAKSRLVSVENIDEIIEKAENYFTKIELLKKCQIGTKVEYAELVQCNSYSRNGSYYADSTQIILQKGSGNNCWFLVLCHRVGYQTCKCSLKDMNITFTKNAIEYLERNLILKLEKEF